MFLGRENQQISLVHKAELWTSDQLSVVTKGNKSNHVINDHIKYEKCLVFERK